MSLETKENVLDILKDKKNRRIIAFSKSGERYPYLKSFCFRFKDSTSEIVLENIGMFDERQMLTLNNFLSQILNACRKEWDWDKSKKIFGEKVNFNGNKVICELCDNNKIKEKYYIKNKFNGKRLGLGSKCIIQYTERGFEDRSQKSILEHSQKLFQENLILQEVPQLFNRIKEIEAEVDSFKIIIKAEVDNPYRMTLNNIESVLEKFKKEEIDLESAKKQLIQLLSELEDNFSTIRDYVNLHLDKEFIGTKKISEYLHREKKMETYNALRNTGFIKPNFAHEILEKEFVLFVKKKSNISLQKYNIEITEYMEDEKKFILKILNYQDILLTIKVKNFIKIISEKLIYNHEEISKEYLRRIIDLCLPYDERSKILTIEMLNEKMRYSSIEIYLDDKKRFYDPIESNEIDLNNKLTGKTKVISLTTLIYDCLVFVFDLNDLNVNEYIQDYYNKSRAKETSRKALNEFRNNDMSKRMP